MNKRHFWYITLPFQIIFGLFLVALAWVGWTLSQVAEIGLNLGSRLEWWCFDEHENLDQPLNPFNISFKDMFRGKSEWEEW